MTKISVRNISRLDLNLLVTFHCLMNERSATRASAILHVTQGAVSSALRRLRDHFEDELFIRSSSGMVPTRRALEIAPHVTEALSSISSILSLEPEFSPLESNYIFNIGLSDDIESYIAPILVKKISTDNLNISFAFHQSNSCLWKKSLEDKNMDLVICSEPKDISSSYSTSVLFSSSYACLYRNRDSPFSQVLTLDEYFCAKHVRVSFDGRRGFMDDLFEAVGHKRHVVASFTHFTGALSTLMNVDVIATIPAFAATTYAQMMDLNTAPVPVPVPSFRCFMVWDIAKHSKPHHLWLRHFVAEAVRGFPVKG
ncbi:transcriptional regulator [Pseudomonas sp. RIT-PI-q]|uniref:LysR family transcriptional regulator n=1 Tax=Pseudomonas sp. RIT-PI-q TaxID=1690247 RepID=UPI0006CCC11C|nr:LysR family transcriptional regulator [Pseudomonas sp. RIT-PI-q]KPG95959.1 transcriptional regulator [Pseudomonas sp. RIT-PI-q]